MSKKNRLIIIGNGFDLANGLKTSYKHFLDYLLKKYLFNLITEETSGFENQFYTLDLKNSDNRNVTISKKFNINHAYSCENYHYIFKDLSNQIINSSGIYGAILYPNNFFLEILLNKQCERNWVDIEYEYFQTLKLVYYNKIENYNIDQFNRDFKNINEALYQYLYTLNYNEEIHHRYIEFIKNNINEYHKTIILNFNYTQLISTFTLSNLQLKKEQVEILNIHGIINKSDSISSPYHDHIVFGYGNENDSFITEIESDSNNVDYLNNIKSFDYGLLENYNDLDFFVESMPFETYIWGHSCGLSDGTLLSFIFEHKNCEKITIWHHNKENDCNTKNNNYKETYQNISRHFKDKIMMRKKVQPYNLNNSMPQKFNQ